MSDDEIKLSINKRQIKQVDKVIESQLDELQEIGFINKMLCLTSLPYKDVKRDLKNPYQWERENGYFKLRILSPIGVGVPFGIIPRQILFYIISEVVKTKEKRIYLGNSFQDFMRKININHFNNYHRARVKDQVKRLADSSISIHRVDYKNNSEKKVSLDITDSFELWRKTNVSDNQQSLFNPYIELRQEFYSDILETPIPLPTSVLKNFSTAMELDIIFWLSYRNYNLKKPQKIKYETLSLQFGSTYNRVRDFKKYFLKALNNVKDIVWNDLRFNDDNKDYLIIKPSKLLVSKKK